MDSKQILSVGIDIGTSTSQLVFSRLELRNRAAACQIPRFEITDRRIVWQSPMAFTPLTDVDTLDEAALDALIRGWYAEAGVRPEDVETGAVIVTGESLAQVASQTMAALACTDAAQDLPVLRPCIGMDKIEIINISRKIGTFETSIEPYEDCCTIFTPPHPKTNPTLDEILAAEAAMPELAALEAEAAENVEKIYIRMGEDDLL